MLVYFGKNITWGQIKKSQLEILKICLCLLLLQGTKLGEELGQVWLLIYDSFSKLFQSHVVFAEATNESGERRGCARRTLYAFDCRLVRLGERSWSREMSIILAGAGLSSGHHNISCKIRDQYFPV